MAGYLEVTLTPAEMLLGAIAGVMRQVQNLGDNRKPAHGAGDRNDWQLHVEGALGEQALAKALGLYWSGKGGLRAPDVGRFEVRTRSEHWHELPLHPEDSDDRRFWLVTGRNGQYRVRGWILGAEGKRDDWWRDPSGEGRPAYWVPQGELCPPDGATPTKSPS
jgi:hypothetical protein